MYKSATCLELELPDSWRAKVTDHCCTSRGRPLRASNRHVSYGSQTKIRATATSVAWPWPPIDLHRHHFKGLYRIGPKLHICNIWIWAVLIDDWVDLPLTRWRKLADNRSRGCYVYHISCQIAFHFHSRECECKNALAERNKKQEIRMTVTAERKLSKDW